MKKFILLIISILVLSSCGATRYTLTFGDVSILNSEGEVIQQWDDSVLESEVSGSSLKFTDTYGNTHFVSGVPFRVDNIETITFTGNEEEDIEYD